MPHAEPRQLLTYLLFYARFTERVLDLAAINTFFAQIPRIRQVAPLNPPLAPSYPVILMSGPEGRRERSGPGHRVRRDGGRRPSPLVQVRVIRLVHYFRTTHIIHICTSPASLSHQQRTTVRAQPLWNDTPPLPRRSHGVPPKIRALRDATVFGLTRVSP